MSRKIIQQMDLFICDLINTFHSIKAQKDPNSED